jgi:hypothetical protein
MSLKNKNNSPEAMRILRAALLGSLLLLLLQGCEDDPILEPTDDESGGGSYGKMSPLSAPRPARLRGANPETF